ncbi:hypothetical protein PCCS19_36840 [Paenibacillus sp. CCS19]|nr:hypothetical protein PCCS19_36840 [Paenibacillus cellulosilyticus]
MERFVIAPIVYLATLGSGWSLSVNGLYSGYHTDIEISGTVTVVIAINSNRSVHSWAKMTT